MNRKGTQKVQTSTKAKCCINDSVSETKFIDPLSDLDPLSTLGTPFHQVSGCFCVILFTDKHTNKQDRKHNLLGGGRPIIKHGGLVAVLPQTARWHSLNTAAAVAWCHSCPTTLSSETSDVTPPSYPVVWFAPWCQGPAALCDRGTPRIGLLIQK